MGKSLDKAFLNSIERIGFMAEQAIRDTVRRRTIALKEFLQGTAVSVCQARQQLFVRWDPRHCSGDSGHEGIFPSST